MAKSENAQGWATLTALIFNKESHGHQPGDIECWLSMDGGKTWRFGSAATQHEPETIRMNHGAGLAANGDLLVLTSGWSNHPFEKGRFEPEVGISKAPVEREKCVVITRRPAGG